MDNPPRVVLLGKLSAHGESFHSALQSVCTVKWIARKSVFRTNPVLFPISIVRELLRLLVLCQSVPEDRRPIVIVHFIGLDAIPAFIVRRVTRCKVMLYAVGPDVRVRNYLPRRSFLIWAVRRADRVLCESSGIEKKVRNLGGTTTRVLPAPFVPFDPGADGKREFDVVTVGSLDDRAKHSLLVEAAAYLDPSVRIAIVGSGPEREYLTTLSRRDGRNQVTFLGDLPPERLQRTLRSSGLYVECSRGGSGTSSVLQAVWCGLPVIALDGEGGPELTRVYGIRSLVPKDHRSVSLALEIEGALENYPSLLEEVSTNREALESFSRSWPEMAETAIFS